MTSKEEYESRRKTMEGMYAALMEGLPVGPLGFLYGYRELLAARKRAMVHTLPVSRLIEFGMYNSYRRCRMN